VSGWELNRVFVTVPPGGPITIPAPCTPGKRVLGGGSQITPPLPGVWIFESDPSNTGEGWVVTLINQSATEISLRVSAICAFAT
jgi:hypothetical protein